MEPLKMERKRNAKKAPCVLAWLPENTLQEREKRRERERKRERKKERGGGKGKQLS